MENPLFLKLQAHNKEMVMGFATVVENKDGSTGGHIHRTTTYVGCFTAFITIFIFIKLYQVSSF